MAENSTIVTVASWEPRFVLGLERLLEENDAKIILMYYFEQYELRTRPARESAKQLAQSRGAELIEKQLQFSRPVHTWRTLQADLIRAARSTGIVILDITTMPRETIWASLFWLEEAGASSIRYAYHRPQEYSASWLARDPDEPRISFKMAGTPALDRPTALIAVTGFDIERTVQAIAFFEPAQTILATQVGIQFDNSARNAEQYRVTVSNDDRIVRREIDSYAAGHGYESLRSSAEGLARRHNVVMLSFGPKPSAIALYRIQRMMPETALAYIHCKDYNENYSKGIGETITASLPRRVPG